MGQVQKTVVISYRRTNAGWALAVYKDLTEHGYDVFFDFLGIASGDFERVILENIKARAHFLVLLTPSALERVDEPGDWLRREIEFAMQERRTIVPRFLEGFDFGAPAITRQMTGSLADLRRYNGLSVPADYFDAAMERLRSQYLNVSLDAVLHPATSEAVDAAKRHQAAAEAAPSVAVHDLTASEWFERAFDAVDMEEKVRCYSEAIRLKPDYVKAYNNRGLVRERMADYEAAAEDYQRYLDLGGVPRDGDPAAVEAKIRKLRQR